MITTIQTMQFDLLNELLAIASAPKSVGNVLRQSLEITSRAFEEYHPSPASDLDSAPARETAAGIYFLVGKTLQLMAHRGLPVKQTPQLHRIPLDSPIGRQCDATTELIPLDDNATNQTALERTLAALGFRAIVVSPLYSHDKTLGCAFWGVRHKGTLNDQARQYLDTVGRTIGLGIHNSRLYQQMAHRLRQSEALYQVSRAFATLDLDQLLDLIVHSAVDTIRNAKNGVLHLLDEKTGELLPSALSFEGEGRTNILGRTRMRVGQGVAGVALETGQAVNVPDVSKDDRFIRVSKGRPFASMLVAPLKLADRQIGTLSIDSEELNAFTQADEQLLMTLATQAAAAIENARLFTDLQRSLQDLKATQEELIQSAKLSAIGQLIAGVAHELNNPLTAVMGYAQLLQTAEGVDDDLRRDLNKILLQAQRAAKIVQNLLTFARQHKGERQYIDVNEVLECTLELHEYQLRVENIQVVKQLAPCELGTLVDRNQLQTVFLNLIKNAEDVMIEHHGGGQITVTSELVGDMIRIEFTDDGPGLTEDVQPHLFEPFFTTKEVGKGTGLGLSICFGIVSHYGGRIWATNGPGKGATFVVELPAAQKNSAAAASAEEVHFVPLPTIESKLVLVVEDEKDVASLLERVLMEDGHKVVIAQDGRMALEHLARAQENDTYFDLIISDIKMPGLSGIELYRRLCQRDPELAQHFIFVTGDITSPRTRNFLRSTNVPYFSKPFSNEDLRRAIAQVFQLESA
jgi:signal transduction histidine kinase/ActR/RegA family two-component response regulator